MLAVSAVNFSKCSRLLTNKLNESLVLLLENAVVGAVVEEIPKVEAKLEIENEAEIHLLLTATSTIVALIHTSSISAIHRALWECLCLSQILFNF